MKKKEIISLPNEEKKYVMSKKLIVYVEKVLALMIIIKSTIKLEIIAIILENI